MFLNYISEDTSNSSEPRVQVSSEQSTCKEQLRNVTPVDRY